MFWEESWQHHSTQLLWLPSDAHGTSTSGQCVRWAQRRQNVPWRKVTAKGQILLVLHLYHTPFSEQTGNWGSGSGEMSEVFGASSVLVGAWLIYRCFCTLRHQTHTTYSQGSMSWSPTLPAAVVDRVDYWKLFIAMTLGLPVAANQAVIFHSAVSSSIAIQGTLMPKLVIIFEHSFRAGDVFLLTQQRLRVVSYNIFFFCFLW